jgi:hypothetical protein
MIEKIKIIGSWEGTYHIYYKIKMFDFKCDVYHNFFYFFIYSIKDWLK